MLIWCCTTCCLVWVPLAAPRRRHVDPATSSAQGTAARGNAPLAPYHRFRGSSVARPRSRSSVAAMESSRLSMTWRSVRPSRRDAQTRASLSLGSSTTTWRRSRPSMTSRNLGSADARRARGRPRARTGARGAGAAPAGAVRVDLVAEGRVDEHLGGARVRLRTLVARPLVSAGRAMGSRPRRADGSARTRAHGRRASPRGRARARRRSSPRARACRPSRIWAGWVIQRRFNVSPRARSGKKHPRVETAPRDDRSSKNQPIQAESGRGRSL